MGFLRFLVIIPTVFIVNVGLSDFFNGGSIESEADMLTADTKEIKVIIESVEMEGVNGTYVFEGCGKSRCTFDISHVESGTYSVMLHLSDGSEIVELEEVQ